MFFFHFGEIPSNAQASYKIMHYLSLCALYLEDQHFQLEQNEAPKCAIYMILKMICAQLPLTYFFLFQPPHSFLLPTYMDIRKKI